MSGKSVQKDKKSTAFVWIVLKSYLRQRNAQKNKGGDDDASAGGISGRQKPRSPESAELSGRVFWESRHGGPKGGYSPACTAVRAMVFTMSCTLQPRDRSLQGLASPCSTA